MIVRPIPMIASEAHVHTYTPTYTRLRILAAIFFFFFKSSRTDYLLHEQRGESKVEAR